LSVALVLKGEAWYLRKQMAGERKDHSLKVFGGEANRKRAEKAAVALERQLQQAHAASGVLAKMGLQPQPAAKKADQITLAQWWKRYQEVYEPRKATRTQTADKARMEQWMALLGEDTPMVDIKQIDCLNAMNARRKQKQANKHRKNPTVVTESTVQRGRILIQAVFERAVENDVIPKNPWAGIEKAPDVPRPNRILTEDDEVKLFEAIRNPAGCDGNVTQAKPEIYIRFVTFMVETGLRLDELLNEHFEDRKTHVHVVGKFAKHRDVPLTKRARKALDDQIQAEGKRWHQHPTRFWGVLQKAAKRAGIPHIGPHDLRHTFGHRFLARGGNLYVLSKLLGHASVKVTEKHYAYLSQEDIATKMLAVMDRDAA
jgi:integrase